MNSRRAAGALCTIGTVLASIALAGVAAAVPTDFSFTGTFGMDDDVQLFAFTADGVSNITLRSYGYAGGTNAAGEPDLGRRLRPHPGDLR